MKNKSENPFKTPEGYFDSFQDRLLKNFSGDGTAFPKNAGFSVPEDHFETFRDKLYGRLTKNEVKVIPLFKDKRFIRIAASVAAIAIIFLGYQWNSNEEVNFGSLANADIEAYFEDNEFGLTSYDIAEVLPLDDMEISDIIDNHLEDENIVDYLNEHVDDFEELNIQNNE